MPARPAERHAVAIAADLTLDQIETLCVDAYKIGYPAGHLLGQKVPRTAQVAEALFADICDKNDRAAGLDPRFVQRADDGQHHRQAAAIVADARTGQHRAVALDGNVGALGENSVEMGRERKRTAAAGAGTFADDIALTVDADVLEPELGKPLFVIRGTRLFLKGRGRYLAGLDLFGDGLGLDRADKVERPHGLRA